MKIEEWNCSNNEQERHYFKDNDQEYLFGYNPALIPNEVIIPVIKYLEDHF